MINQHSVCHRHLLLLMDHQRPNQRPTTTADQMQVLVSSRCDAKWSEVKCRVEIKCRVYSKHTKVSAVCANFHHAIHQFICLQNNYRLSRTHNFLYVCSFGVLGIFLALHDKCQVRITATASCYASRLAIALEVVRLLDVSRPRTSTIATHHTTTLFCHLADTWKQPPSDLL